MKCEWNTGTECGGKIQAVEILNRGAICGLTINICETHLKEHKLIMHLYVAGYDIIKILEMGADKRLALVEELTNKENEDE